MKRIFQNRFNIIFVSAMLVICIGIGVTFVVRRNSSKSRGSTGVTEFVTSSTAPKYTEVGVSAAEARLDENAPLMEKIKRDKIRQTEEPTEGTTVQTETATGSSGEKTTETDEEDVPHIFATAAPAAQKASYSEQWNKGYLVAIDNPDKNYSCPHIELSDKNRDLLERLCMGEMGGDGFTGAALIAQAVKNEMNTFGIYDVAALIDEFHYEGRTDKPASTACKKAVVYVFDMDKDAVQHRILYNYNPTYTRTGFSAFHESQTYVCNLGTERFFDKK